MKTIAIVLGLSLVACGGIVESSDPEPAPVLARECNGANLRQVCGQYKATSGARYGLEPSCSGTPFLDSDSDGGVTFRDDGQLGCVDVGKVSFDGVPYARCCP